MHVRWILVEFSIRCSIGVRCMPVGGSLDVRWRFVGCSRHACGMLRVCSLDSPWMLYYMLDRCLLDDRSIPSGSSQDILWVLVGFWSDSRNSVFDRCSLDARWMFVARSLDAR